LKGTATAVTFPPAVPGLAVPVALGEPVAAVAVAVEPLPGDAVPVGSVAVGTVGLAVSSVCAEAGDWSLEQPVTSAAVSRQLAAAEVARAAGPLRGRRGDDPLRLFTSAYSLSVTTATSRP
jgi:hypothetical protein